MNLNTEFAFEGFRLAKKKPGLIAAWSVIILLLSVIVIGVLFSAFMPLIMSLKELETSTPSDPKAALAIMSSLAPVIGLAMPLGLVIGAVMRCAVFRALEQSKPKFWGYLGFGADELRQMVLMIAVGLVIGGFWLLLLLGGGLVIGLTVAATSGLIDMAKGMIIGLVSLITVLAGFFVLFAFMVRISLASAQTYATKKIMIFDSLRLTKGNAWNLFVGYFIIFVISIVMAIFMAVFRVMGMGFGMVSLSSFDEQTFKSITQGHMPADLSPFYAAGIFLVIYLLIHIVVNVVTYAAYYAAPMAAYKELSGTKVDAE